MNLNATTTDGVRASLPVAETALLWGIRAWAAGRRRGIDAEDGITLVFTRLGAPLAPGYLYGLMWVLRHGAARTLALNRPCDRGVSADEQALLDVLALTQERQGFERLLLLRTLLNPMAATPAGRSATGLVRELNAAGLFLSPCFPDVRRHAFAPPQPARQQDPA